MALEGFAPRPRIVNSREELQPCPSPAPFLHCSDLQIKVRGSNLVSSFGRRRTSPASDAAISTLHIFVNLDMHECGGCIGLGSLLMLAGTSLPQRVQLCTGNLCGWAMHLQ